jgi:dienelactone hydrolase
MNQVWGEVSEKTSVEKLHLTMKVIDGSVDLQTASGLMRCFIASPMIDGMYINPIKNAIKFAAVIVFTEIYQVTAPLKRFCRQIASEGYIAICPESYHEFEAPGTALGYDDEGTNRGNLLKITKPLENYDSDNVAIVQYLLSRPDCTGKIGSVGMCLGGHLSFRCALLPEILASVCFFATDVHSKTLGAGKNSDSLERSDEIKGELLMIFGRQDPHIPREGRDLIRKTLADKKLNFAWVEVNAEHAFIRDESSKGRYNPSITRLCVDMMFELFHRRLQLDNTPQSKKNSRL